VFRQEIEHRLGGAFTVAERGTVVLGLQAPNIVGRTGRCTLSGFGDRRCTYVCISGIGASG
jgi:hypothetical protein